MTDEKFNRLQSDISEQKKLMNQIALNTKPIFSIEDASALSGYSVNYLYKLVQANKIKYSRPSGKKIFFKREDLLDFLTSGEVKTEDNYLKEVENFLQRSLPNR